MVLGVVTAPVFLLQNSLPRGPLLGASDFWKTTLPASSRLPAQSSSLFGTVSHWAPVILVPVPAPEMASSSLYCLLKPHLALISTSATDHDHVLQQGSDQLAVWELRRTE